MESQRNAYDLSSQVVGNDTTVATETSHPEVGKINVRGEEIGIVIMVLLLWVGAIILFFNRWGKIRMLEPYQPKFCENHRPSCPMAEVSSLNGYSRTFSKFNLSNEKISGTNASHFAKCNYHGIATTIEPVAGYSGMSPGALSSSAMRKLSVSAGMGAQSSHPPFLHSYSHSHSPTRPRQNSVFVGSAQFPGPSLIPLQSGRDVPRKTKSAMDLSNLVLSEEFLENVRRNSKSSITQV